ncbi:MAG: nucleotidyltransferase substrate binding protein [Verrucomicrobiota bacterium]|nr:nucleotidyltransferase substrate binding protein [Verrucomicrobiota bacterium]
MSKERFTERKIEVRNANARLQEAVAQPETPILRDAIIQRFEFTFELTWKCLQLYLQHLGLECGSPRATLKKAFSEGLIETPEEADVWLQMLEDRNLTSHAYDESLAQGICQRIRDAYAPLLNCMAQRIQTLPWD